MKFKVNKRIIDDVISKASKIAAKHLTLPVLSCLYLEVISKDLLCIKSTNIDLGLEISVKIENGQTGILAAPANVLLSTISSVNSDFIEVESVDSNLKIISKNNTALIKCMPHDDFPSIPKIEDGKTIKIKAQDIVNGLRSVSYSASTSNIKPELSSVYVYNDGDFLVFVSTDSFRLAEKKLHTSKNTDFEPIIIPQKNVVEILRIFDGYKGDIDLVLSKNQLVLKSPELYLISRLIDGNFPDYKQIIPKDFQTRVTVLKSDLSNSIKTSNIFSDSLNQVKFKIEKGGERLSIESKNNDVGEYRESLQSSVDGEAIELNFNSRYVTDCFQSIVSENIILEFAGIGKPLLIKGASDNSFSYIVMPMNK